MTVHHAQIPVLVMIDAEPTGFFIPRHRPDAWRGFERGLEIIADIRRSLVRRGGRDVHFTWLIRADPQVEEVYGNAAWGLTHYADQLRALEAHGDEIGLHVHAYRWDNAEDNWIEDYGNQSWVDHCVEVGCAAFESTQRRPAAAFSMGMDWSNQTTMEMARERGVRWELSLISGAEPVPMRFASGTYTGTAPDCTRIPRLPYAAARDDFSRSVAGDSDSMWIFPLTSHVAPIELWWKRRLVNMLRLRRTEQRTRKFFLTDAPSSLCPAIDEVLRGPSPYLTFSVRTDRFLHRRSVTAIRKNLEHLMELAGDAVVFATPAEILQILDAQAAPVDQRLVS